MANRVPAVDNSSYQLPPAVRDRIAANVLTPVEVEGAALRDHVGKWLVYDVRRYGAVADGTTNDSAAFQAASDAAAAAGGGVVRVPPGDYAIGTVIRLGANVTVSMHGATLHRTLPGGDIFQNWAAGDTTTTAYNGRSRISILGGVIDSHGDTYTLESNVVAFNHCKDIYLRGVTFRRTRGFHALELNGVDGAFVDACRFEGYNAGAQSGKEAIQIDSANPGDSGAADGTMAKNITIRDTYFGPYGAMGAPEIGVGSHSHNASDYYININVVGCTFETPTSRAVVPYWWDDSSVKDCRITTGSNVQGIRVEASRRLLVSGCKITGTGTFGITVLVSSSDTVITNNHINGVGQGIYDGAGNTDTEIIGNHVKRTSSYAIVADGSTDCFIASNVIWGAGYTGGAAGAIRFAGNAVRPGAVGNKVRPHGAGTDVSAGISVAAGTTDAWGFGNNFRGIAAATSGTINTTSNWI